MRQQLSHRGVEPWNPVRIACPAHPPTNVHTCPDSPEVYAQEPRGRQPCPCTNDRRTVLCLPRGYPPDMQWCIQQGDPHAAGLPQAAAPPTSSCDSNPRNPEGGRPYLPLPP